MIVQHPDPILRQVSEPVRKDHPDIRGIVTKMRYELRKSRSGIGLSAIQIGIPLRLFVVDIPQTPTRSDWRPYIGDFEDEWREVLINPEILETEEAQESEEESCLSIPESHVTISRPKQITVSYTTLSGDRITEVLTTLHARVFQHELDHLNGRLIIDYL